MVAKPSTIAECVIETGLTRKQIRHLLDVGMPSIRRGRKGRGCPTLLDPRTVLDFAASKGKLDFQNIALARGMVRSLATGLCAQFRQQSGPHKAALAANVVESFRISARAIRTELGLPQLDDSDLPEMIRQLAAVGAI